jgi:hypothetical protein
MDPNYLKATVGIVLAEGMRATTEADPPDPIEFLATWLLHYRDHQDGCADFRTAYANIQTEREEYLAKVALELERLEEERRLREEELKRIEEEKRLAKEAALRKRKAEEEESSSEDEPAKEPTPEDPPSGSGYSGYTD